MRTQPLVASKNCPKITLCKCLYDLYNNTIMEKEAV